MATETWEEVVARLSKHTVSDTKDSLPMFSPSIVAPNGRRHDSQVRGVSMGVFDVDLGSEKEVEACRERIRTQGVAQHWYTSFSYRPDAEKAAWRLVIPLTAPVPPEHWGLVRGIPIARFGIPCDQKKCGGLSHAYYLPSHPPGATPKTHTEPGAAVDVTGLTGTVERQRLQGYVVAEPSSRPEAPEGILDLKPLRDILQRRAANLSRRSEKTEQDKTDLLRKCLAGEPLAAHGGRDNAAMILAGVIAAALPEETSILEMWLLMQASVQAMIAEGSSLTEAAVRQKLERSAIWADKNRAEEQARWNRIEQMLEQAREAL